MAAFATYMVSNRPNLLASTQALEAVHESTDKPYIVLGNLTLTVDHSEVARAARLAHKIKTGEKTEGSAGYIGEKKYLVSSILNTRINNINIFIFKLIFCVFNFILYIFVD